MQDKTDAVSKGPNSLLIVGPGARMRRDVGSKVAQAWPTTKVDIHEPHLGQPQPEVLSGYDGILIAHDLELRSESGLVWLNNLREAGTLPPAVLMTDSTESLISETALRSGASACVLTAQLSAKVLCETFARDDNLSTHTQRDRSGNVVAPRRAASNSNREASQSRKSSAGNNDVGAVDVPGYRVERLIAHGGMSAVYRAVREGDDQLVALKILQLGEEYDGELIHRFMREYASVARLSHPNLITIEERGFAADFAYIAMEYCPCGDLKGRLQLGLTHRDVLDYARQMALGLGAAHRIGLIHRDVKPGNMLFREDGTLVVCDFGVAKDVTETDRNLTMPKAVVGTVYYVSPEQVKGDPIDARSDLYGLGGVIYQMLTGMPPFVGQDRVEIMEAHVSKPVPQLPDKHSQFQSLVDGLLAKDPDERFQTADEVVEGLNWIEESLL